MKKLVIALGGNALLKKGDKGTAEETMKNIEEFGDQIIEMKRKGYTIAITHGNGPQVGRIMLQNELAQESTPPMPMDVCGAMSQGMIGYFLQNTLTNLFQEAGLKERAITLITQVLVDREDPSFKNPTKPVGMYYSQKEAEELVKERGYVVTEDSNRGYRRVVPSPIPKKIIERETIQDLIDQGTTVITVGGGGIPVVKEKNRYMGVEAVIDKDLASTVLAEDLKAHSLLILTQIDAVYLHFGKENEERITRTTPEKMEEYLKEGHFSPGSMLPKIQAAIEFVKKSPGRKAIITSLEKGLEGLEEREGTIICYEEK